MVDLNKQELGNIQLFQDVKSGDVQRAQELIAQGADVNAEDNFGCSPLHYAVKSNYLGEHKGWVDGNKDIVQLLIEKGADIDARDKHRNTPLHSAMSCRTKDIPMLLIDKGVYLNPRNNSGNLPLHDAVESPHPSNEVVECLIENGADINVSDKRGRTPLHLVAAQGGDNNDFSPLGIDRWRSILSVAKLLVEKGANLDAQDKDGNTPLDLAPEHHDYDRGYIETAMQRILKRDKSFEARVGSKEARER